MTADPDRPYFYRGDQGRRRPLFPGVDIRTVAGDSMMLSVVRFEPDSVVPDHSHPHEQMGLLVSGRLAFTVGGVTEILEAGDMWRIPSNVPHSVVAVGGPAVALDVFHPIREDYL